MSLDWGASTARVPACDGQPSAALQVANASRLHHVAVKETVGSIDSDRLAVVVALALTDPMCRNLTLRGLFSKRLYWGPARRGRVAGVAGTHPERRIGELTERQVGLVVDLLRERGDGC